MAMKLSPDAIRDLMKGLLGRNVAVNAIKPLVTLKKGTWVIAVYHDDKDKVAGVAVAEVALGNYAGAALALVPPERAQSAANDGSLDGELSDNFYEILNVAASLYPASGGAHVRIVEMTTNEPADFVHKLVRKPKARTDVMVDVDGYGKGRLTFVAA